MIIAIGYDSPELGLLSADDRRLAELDVLMFGFCCIRRDGDKRSRIDPQEVEFRNGKWYVPNTSTRIVLRDPCVDKLSNVLKTERARHIEFGDAWKQALGEALRMPVDTSGLPIWKKHDPGAK